MYRLKEFQYRHFQHYIFYCNNYLQNNKLMIYKGRDYNLIYLNKDIFQLIKGVVMEYFKDEDDLIFELKKSLLKKMK